MFRFYSSQSLGSVQRNPRLFNGVRRVVGHGPRISEVVRRRRGSGHRQFRTQHAAGIPYVRVRQPLPSGAAQLSARFRIGRRGNRITINSSNNIFHSPYSSLNFRHELSRLLLLTKLKKM